MRRQLIGDDMLLKELFSKVPEDFAMRPLGSGVPQNIPTFDPRYSKVVGTQDGQDVWGSREKRNFEIFGFKDKDEVTAYIIIEENTTDGAHALRELWVNPNHRRKGYGTGLILFLTRKIGIALLLKADEIVSPDARSVILKCIQDKLVKATSSDSTSPADALKIAHKTDTSIRIFEKQSGILFAAKMVLDDNTTTFAEHSLVNVSEESEYD